VPRPGRSRRADSRYAEQAVQLAAFLRERREQKGLSQEQLAFRAGVAVSTVRKIETSTVIEPGYFTVLSLLRVLDADNAYPGSAPEEASRV
jgi:transcriptional regulator with XRE-family HTH domain